MPIAFFVSSIGDTDLAKATISKLVEQKVDKIFLIPITSTAAKRTEDLIDTVGVVRLPLSEIILKGEILSTEKMDSEELEKISLFIEKNEINQAYIGVPSPVDEEIPFQIAGSLKIPCTIAYEYMFTAPPTHSFWRHVNTLASQNNCDFAVPMKKAEEDMLKINPSAKVNVVGHISVDRALRTESIDTAPIRNLLQVNDNDELILISGTTQPIEVDNQFLDALLNEIATGKYPNLQLRFGIHPGVRDMNGYLQMLLETCKKYPETQRQFKIILPSALEKRLQYPLSESTFILRAEVSGADVAQAANKVTQAVPGALLNEAALIGKPSYFHNKSTNPYLPEAWFSESISLFFTAKPQPSHSREELELEDTTPNLMAKLMRR